MIRVVLGLAWMALAALPVMGQEMIEPDDSLRAFLKEYVTAINETDLQKRDALCRKLAHPKCLEAMASKKYAGYMEGYFTGARLKPPIEEKYTVEAQVLTENWFKPYLRAGAYALVVTPTHGITIQDREQAASPKPNRWVFALKEDGKWWWVITLPSDKQLAESGL